MEEAKSIQAINPLTQNVGEVIDFLVSAAYKFGENFPEQ